jgi:DNA polymerase-3 subunit delta'
MLNVSGIIGHRTQIKRLSQLIEKGAIPQTLLFSGISGTGKCKIAKAFLTSLFCKNENPPCTNCSLCKQILAGTFPDFIEMHPNERGIIPIGSEEKKEYGTIRWLIDRLSKKSITDKYVALIDGVDRISVEGQNALLKTIEEPSENKYILLISSNRSSILPTILSRCFDLKFYPLDEKSIATLLIDKGLSKPEAIFASKISGGSVEIAYALTNNEIMEKILTICAEISLFLKGKGSLDINLTEIQKIIDIDRFIDISLNIYRLNMLMACGSVNQRDFPPHRYDTFLSNIYLDDMPKLLSIIKIFLALKRGRSYNLNIKNSIKGMLYSLKNRHTMQIPLLR